MLLLKTYFSIILILLVGACTNQKSDVIAGATYKVTKSKSIVAVSYENKGPRVQAVHSNGKILITGDLMNDAMVFVSN